MRRFIFITFLIAFAGHIIANDFDFTKQIQQYGDEGDFFRMDSIYSLACRQINYSNDPVSALDLNITYATYLNSKRDYTKAYFILKDAREEAIRLKDRKYSSETRKQIQQSEGIATYEIAYGLWSSNKLYEARKFTDEAIDLFVQIKDTARLAESYNLSGVIHKNLFMLDKAILMYKEALKITEYQKDYNLSAIIISNIATLYNELEETQQAITFSRKIFSYPQTDTLAFNNQINKISYLCNHAILLTNGEYYHNALDSLQLATKLLQENMPAGLKLYVYTNYAKALYDTGDSRSAIRYYQKAISYKKQTQNEYNIANLDYLYGYMLFQATDSLQQAHNYLSKALAFYRKNPSIMLTKSLLALAEIESKRNHPQTSYQLALEAYETEQKIQHKSFHNRLAGFEAELETKEKDLKIISLNAEQAKNKAAYQTRTYIISSILVLIVLLSVIIIISLQKRKVALKLKHSELEKELKNKEAQSKLLIGEMNKKMTDQYLKGLEDSNEHISKELHNDVCNELLAIEMQLKQTSAGRLATQLGEIRENVRNISHQLSAPNFSNISLYQMFNLYIEKLNTLNTLTIHPYISDDIMNLTIPSENIVEIYRILQEIISNIIKHANARNMYLTVGYDQNEVEIVIEDDGKGFDTSLSPNILTSGLGLKTIKERSYKLQGECKIESTLGKGTIIHMRFPA